ncbi:MAG: hypothetical protein E7Z91_04810 [Cyanobacteria bacterium SIG30]|nr:hypothetical protein [Cyanobacteria bacterium SIG30]
MLNTKEKIISLTKEDLIEYYKKGCKKECDFKIGIEWEKISLNKNTYKNANYEDIKKIIEQFALLNDWKILKDNDVIIGALNGKNSISLEPGGQFEISLEAEKDLKEISEKNEEIWGKLGSIAQKYDVIFAPIGLTPYSTYENTEIVKKDRYLIMQNFFENFGGKLYSVMMKETAGIQVNFDYKNEDDAMLKLKTSIMVSPFSTGFFANSYIRNNKINGYKSYRANAWLDTDKKRCGIFYKNILKNNDAKFIDYIDSIIKVPMLFIERNNEKIIIKEEMTFEDFMQNGYKGHSANLNDYILHSSLTFPDVRLKNYIEIRNHDSQKIDMVLALCAFYKGIFSKRETMESVLSYLDFGYDTLKELIINSAKFGLAYNYKGIDAFKVTKKLFKIAFDSLNNQEDKILLLESLKMLENKTTIADIALEKNISDTNKLIDYLLK